MRSGIDDDGAIDQVRDRRRNSGARMPRSGSRCGRGPAFDPWRRTCVRAPAARRASAESPASMRAEIARTGSVPPLICTSRVSKNDTGSSVRLAARTSSVSGTVGACVELVLRDEIVDHGDEPIRRREGQRPEQRRMQQRINDGVGADAERQCQDGQQRRARLPQKHPRAVGQVPRQRINPHHDARLPHVFLGDQRCCRRAAAPLARLRHARGPAACTCRSASRRETCSSSSSSLSTDRRRNRLTNRDRRRHGDQAFLRTRPTALVSADQCASSSARRRRPTAVMV